MIIRFFNTSVSYRWYVSVSGRRMMNLELSPRLKIIADSIKGYNSVADIGSDHAYLPIYLVKTFNIKKAVASDVNKGPVEISRERLKQYDVEKHVEVRRGDGLEILEAGETEVIVIAGMGGMLIRDIMEKGKSIIESAKLIILQPMRDSDCVRKWIFGNGFDIIDEELVKEDERIYEVIWASPGSGYMDKDDPMLIGDKIIKKKHPLAAEFIDKKIEELEKVIALLEGKNTINSRKRKEECENLILYYREVKQWVQ